MTLVDFGYAWFSCSQRIVNDLALQCNLFYFEPETSRDALNQTRIVRTQFEIYVFIGYQHCIKIDIQFNYFVIDL